MDGTNYGYLPMKTVLEFEGERLVLTYPCKWCEGTGCVKIELESNPEYEEECAACHGTGEVERQLEVYEIDYR